MTASLLIPHTTTATSPLCSNIGYESPGSTPLHPLFSETPPLLSLARILSSYVVFSSASYPSQHVVRRQHQQGAHPGTGTERAVPELEPARRERADDQGLLKYIKEPLLADAVPPPTSLQLDKRTQAFGFILLHLSFSERQAIEPILALNTQDAYTLWLNIKERHERVTISRVWASWKRLNAAPETTLSDPAGIDAWFTGTIAAYNAYRASGRQLDEYTACLIMLDNLPEMWGAMRRSITQSGNDGNTMTFAVLRNNMESELITRKSDQQLQHLQWSDVSQALVAMRAMMDRPQSGRRQSKRPRVIYQRTPGATCTKCKKLNHTAQQCGKAVEASDQKAAGTAQMTSSDNGARRRTVNLVRRSNNSASFDDYFDSDEPQDSEVNMTTDSNDSDDSSALATTKDHDNPAEPLTRHWLVDCGASHNYFNDPSLLSNIRGCNAGVKLGNGQRLPVIAEGEITLTLPPHGRQLTFTARYVPAHAIL